MTSSHDVSNDEEGEVRRVLVSFNARSKTRYFSESELQRRVVEEDGTLFWSPVQEIFLLRTERTTSHNGRVTIQFVVESDTLTIINQTCDHYDWSAMEVAEYPTLSEEILD